MSVAAVWSILGVYEVLGSGPLVSLLINAHAIVYERLAMRCVARCNRKPHVSYEYNRLSGGYSTVQAAWYVVVIRCARTTFHVFHTCHGGV